MSQILVVGSVALDTLRTPFGEADDALGGSAVHFAAAAALFAPVGLVGVVGSDYPVARLDFLTERGVDLSGLEQAEGSSFRWGGEYGYDLNTRETLFTELGVFADFKPSIPDHLKTCKWVFLGNINPQLQIDVLDQMDSPEFVACDTMNYWIDSERETLMELLARVDLLLVNDEEIRQLSGDPNLYRAARWAQAQGPTHVVIKKGEHGAVLLSDDNLFFVPGYPLEEVFDPTGAGDAFAGGLIGHLARTGTLDLDELKRAMVYGCAMGSFDCEAFGPSRLQTLTEQELADRVRLFRDMMTFEIAPSLAG